MHTYINDNDDNDEDNVVYHRIQKDKGSCNQWICDHIHIISEWFQYVNHHHHTIQQQQELNNNYYTVDNDDNNHNHNNDNDNKFNFNHKNNNNNNNYYYYYNKEYILNAGRYVIEKIFQVRGSDWREIVHNEFKHTLLEVNHMMIVKTYNYS